MEEKLFDVWIRIKPYMLGAPGKTNLKISSSAVVKSSAKKKTRFSSRSKNFSNLSSQQRSLSKNRQLSMKTESMKNLHACQDKFCKNGKLDYKAITLDQH